MKTKRTITFLISSLTMISCFISAHQAEAQSSWSGNYNGTSDQGYVINEGRANYWTYLRLQSGNNHAWNINNEEDLWWGLCAKL